MDLSFNSLTSLKYLNGLSFLTRITASHNQLTKVLDIKQPPLSLDWLDLSNNHITVIPDLSSHLHLRVLKLNSNKLTHISGLQRNRALRVLDLSENLIEEVTGLDGLGLRELYLSSNLI